MLPKAVHYGVAVFTLADTYPELYPIAFFGLKQTSEAHDFLAPLGLLCLVQECPDLGL